MKIIKNGSKLEFFLDDNSTVKYDLATKKTIGKRGNPVKSLTSQLSGISISTIINSIEEENYRDFLTWVERQNKRCLSNFGSILELAKSYSSYEQFFSAGLKAVNISKDIGFSQIPKGLLKIVKGTSISISYRLVRLYDLYPNFFNLITTDTFSSLTLLNCIELISYGFYEYSSRYNKPNIATMNERYNYNMKSLLHYIDDIMTYEALDWSNTVREIYDYTRMMAELSPKFEKYPKHLRTTHDIAVRNYNRLRELKRVENFESTVRPDIETAIDGYVFLCAKTPQDINDEAVQQNNCVASYIDRIITKRCVIAFMRKKESPTNSFITLEIVDNKVVQSKGKHNRDLSDEEKVTLDKYNKFLSKIEEEIA